MDFNYICTNNYKDKYLECLFNNEVINGLNKGFRFDNKKMKTYEQHKIGLSPVYT